MFCIMKIGWLFIIPHSAIAELWNVGMSIVHLSTSHSMLMHSSMMSGWIFLIFGTMMAESICDKNHRKHIWILEKAQYFLYKSIFVCWIQIHQHTEDPSNVYCQKMAKYAENHNFWNKNDCNITCRTLTFCGFH